MSRGGESEFREDLIGGGVHKMYCIFSPLIKLSR